MKKAFTMIELVFVMVVIAILASLAVPNLNQNRLRDAANQLISHIRYTQHLALNDNVFQPNNPTWFQDRWTIWFRTSGYQILKPALGRIAVDPVTGTTLNETTPGSMTNLINEYQITLIDANFGGSCVNANTAAFDGLAISFDNLGRPHVFDDVAVDRLGANATNHIMNVACTITLTDGANPNVIITIDPQTGYVRTP